MISRSANLFRTYRLIDNSSHFTHFVRMIGQSKISSFFSPKGSKKEAAVTISGNENERPAKKQKTDQEKKGGEQQEEARGAEGGSGEPHVQPQLSLELKASADGKKQLAKQKLMATKTFGCVVNFAPSWLEALEPEFSKPYFLKLSEFVKGERQKGTVYPPAHEVFSWTQMSDIRKVKVVILGQDPYHGPQQAHGLCFSVQKGVPPPPSLVNMFKELKTDIEGFQHPGHGYLVGWAEQGVLLLNAVLTVRAHNANSHKDKGWEQFTNAVIQWLNRNLEGVVFILWGGYAQKKGASIDKKRHHILKGPHPSPLSAHRGFFGCKHFSQCNELLKKQGKKTIDWTYLPAQE